MRPLLHQKLFLMPLFYILAVNLLKDWVRFIPISTQSDTCEQKGISSTLAINKPSLDYRDKMVCWVYFKQMSDLVGRDMPNLILGNLLASTWVHGQ